MKFKVGEYVEYVKKIKGYRYFGPVVSAFYTTTGQEKYVVESNSEGSMGMLFIFNETQLELGTPSWAQNV